jgi:hypothetical protein
MKMRRIFLMTAVLLLAVARQQVMAQAANDTAALFAEMRQMNETYNRSLSFGIRITYASEKQPGIVLDSAKGGIAYAGAIYHYWLDSVETFVNKNYSVTLFKKDKVMYLARPSTLGQTLDPAQQMRAVLQKTGYKSCTITQRGGVKTLHIDFGPNNAYRQMEMNIDKKTGYVTSMRYVVNTAMLKGQDAEANTAQAGAEQGEYAIVQTTFDHYQLLPADYAGFDESSFFYKDGQEFKTTSAYNDYKIFTGSPNL